MKLAVVQFNPTIGDCASNLIQIRQHIAAASKAGASLIVLPELAVVGYTPQDLLDSDSLAEASEAAIAELARSTGDITALVGFVERNPAPTGEPFFNSAAVLRSGKVQAIYRKQLLPNYDVFDEKRYFEVGRSPLIIEVEGKRLGVTICEDAWNFPGFLGRNYSYQPLDVYRDARVDGLINLSASPFHLGKPELREKLFRAIASHVGAPLIYSAQVGGNDDLIFDGGTSVTDKTGRVVARAKAFEEAMVVCEWGEPGGMPEWPDTEAAWLAGALTLGIRDYVRKTGGTSVLLGLSGGIDSSVVAGLAVEALGARAVKGILLPTQFTSKASVEDAESLATALEIQTVTLPVGPVYEQTVATLKSALGGLQSLTLENIQPRLRMTLMMAIANEENRFLLNTSNKSELAAGYATLYGDSAGALGVLGDLTKDQVYALGGWLNTRRVCIPRRVFDRAPSAELKEDQKDEDTLPPYEVLDTLVRRTLENGETGEQLESQGFAPEQVTRFLALFRVSEYKRRQFPPILRVSSRAFGRGRRIPVASRKPWN